MCLTFSTDGDDTVASLHNTSDFCKPPRVNGAIDVGKQKLSTWKHSIDIIMAKSAWKKAMWSAIQWRPLDFCAFNVLGSTPFKHTVVVSILVRSFIGILWTSWVLMSPQQVEVLRSPTAEPSSTPVIVEEEERTVAYCGPLTCLCMACCWFICWPCTILALCCPCDEMQV